MEMTVSELRFLLELGRFLGSAKLERMETEALERRGGNELDDADLEFVSAAGEAVFPKEDLHGT